MQVISISQLITETKKTLNVKPPEEKLVQNWDKENSTFYWYMELRKEFIYSPTLQQLIIPGYSKKLFQNENQDKAELLKGCLIRLIERDYLKKILNWRIYCKVNNKINRQGDICILSLYRNTYEIMEGKWHDRTLKTFNYFLSEIYEEAKKEVPNYRRLLKQKPEVEVKSKDYKLDISTYNFNNVNVLYLYADKLKRDGIPDGAIMNFVRKYKEYKRW